MNVQIDGKTFETRASDGEIYHDGVQILNKCLSLRASDADAILRVLRQICDTIDRALGSGTVKSIVGDAPVSLPKALKILNALIAACAESYFGYIQREYLGGGQDKRV